MVRALLPARCPGHVDRAAIARAPDVDGTGWQRIAVHPFHVIDRQRKTSNPSKTMPKQTHGQPAFGHGLFGKDHAIGGDETPAKSYPGHLVLQIALFDQLIELYAQFPVSP